MIEFRHKGNFKKTENFLVRAMRQDFLSKLDKYGEAGVALLAAATPKRTGKTAASWKYDIEKHSDHVSIVWSNTNINNGVPIAIILQYGHGTGNGGYVQGIDYINPALKPLFDNIIFEIFKEVSSL